MKHNVRWHKTHMVNQMFDDWRLAADVYLGLYLYMSVHWVLGKWVTAYRMHTNVVAPVLQRLQEVPFWVHTMTDNILGFIFEFPQNRQNGLL